MGSYKFFANKDCEYYPCHEGMDEMNCLFCYCPLYHTECSGNYRYVRSSDGSLIKSCIECSFPHIPENYDRVIQKLKESL